MQKVLELIGKHDYKQAIKLLEKSLAKIPQDVGILCKIAFCYEKIGKYIEATEKYKIATRYDPQNPDIWQKYGFSLYFTGQISASISALITAANCDPEDSLINHQISYLYYRNNDYENALRFVGRAVLLCKKEEKGYYEQLIAHKALIYENLDKNKAIDTYLNLIDIAEDEPNYYDRLTSLIIDRFKFSENLYKLNSMDEDYNKATHYLRDGNIDKAIELYKNIIRKNKFCYPAYLGISQALYEKRFGINEIEKFSKPKGIENLFKNYDQLNKFEQNIINASIAPLENYVEILNKSDSSSIIVPIDVNLTDFPHNQYLKNKNYENVSSFCALRGIGGDNAFIGVERLRDILWDVPDNIKLTPACVAHEFAHQVWCKLNKDVVYEVKKLFQQSKQANNFISNYSSQNVEEYFAEYYAYYARTVVFGKKSDGYDPMITIIESLRD